MTDRRKLVREGAAQLRQYTATQGPPPVDGEPSPFRNLAEAIAYVTACCRDEGVDEVAASEILLSVVDLPREGLLEAEELLRALGYREIATMMRRLARKARSRPRDQWMRSGMYARTEGAALSPRLSPRHRNRPAIAS
ncbi:hypothetical protein QMZ05_24540 [Bradyrhizobium sp. INPA03-11B]|uniref:hypothetical protein n=1 Tax=Bradyrhizobium sp. INPA03-11B TaxID=418598 RepID=UPI00338FE89E